MTRLRKRARYLNVKCPECGTHWRASLSAFCAECALSGKTVGLVALTRKVHEVSDNPDNAGALEPAELAHTKGTVTMATRIEMHKEDRARRIAVAEAGEGGRVRVCVAAANGSFADGLELLGTPLEIAEFFADVSRVLEAETAIASVPDADEREAEEARTGSAIVMNAGVPVPRCTGVAEVKPASRHGDRACVLPSGHSGECLS